MSEKPRFVCPFHGTVEAVSDTMVKRTELKVVEKGKPPQEANVNHKGYRCPVDGCPVKRLESELEFPVRRSENA